MNDSFINKFNKNPDISLKQHLKSASPIYKIFPRKKSNVSSTTLVEISTFALMLLGGSGYLSLETSRNLYNNFLDN